MVAQRETGTLAERLIRETVRKQGIAPGQLVIHADRGSSMTSKPVAFLMADLGITKTHSRPYTSIDNPYSESQFKTLKYRPEFPPRFGSIEHIQAGFLNLCELLRIRKPATVPVEPHEFTRGRMSGCLIVFDPGRA